MYRKETIKEWRATYFQCAHKWLLAIFETK